MPPGWPTTAAWMWCSCPRIRNLSVFIPTPLRIPIFCGNSRSLANPLSARIHRFNPLNQSCGHAEHSHRRPDVFRVRKWEREPRTSDASMIIPTRALKMHSFVRSGRLPRFFRKPVVTAHYKFVVCRNIAYTCVQAEWGDNETRKNSVGR